MSNATQLTLEIQHSDCWALKVTDETGTGAVGHSIYHTPTGEMKGGFTIYADQTKEIDECLQIIRGSHLTESLTELSQRPEVSNTASNVGNATKSVIVEYEPENSMSHSLLEHGFFHDGPVRVFDGLEYWPVVDTNDRHDIERRIGSIESQKDAEINIARVIPGPEGESDIRNRRDKLSSRQWEAFNLACKRDYYSWPRETTTQELADELDIAKATLLEHLRKAEMKLLDQYRR